LPISEAMATTKTCHLASQDLLISIIGNRSFCASRGSYRKPDFPGSPHNCY
jgi:hypothetical protein